MFRLAQILRVAALLAAVTAAAAAQADCIPISSLPYVVSQSGAYCVTADLSVAIIDGNAISINASDVDVDFQSHTILNTITAAVASVGVRLNADQAPLNNVTIRNGTLHGFGYGVTNSGFITQTSTLTIDHMKISNSYGQAIYLKGTDLRVTNNTIATVFGQPHANGILLHNYRLPNMAAPNRVIVQGNNVSGIRAAAAMNGVATAGIATGMFVVGYPDILIRDNVVSNLWVPKATPDGAKSTGIGVQQMQNADRIGGLIIQDNIVQNSAMYVRASKPNTSTGIWIIYPGDHAIVTGSSIAGMDTGINAGTKYPDTPPVLLLNNTITGATTPIIGGVTLPQ